MIHRALFGSIERFFGVLTEHYAGAFPAWLAPVQVVGIPIADTHVPYLEKVAARLRDKGIRVEIEHRPGKPGKMLGRANKLRARAAVIIGGNEIASGKLTVKDLAHGTQAEVAVADLEAMIRKLLD